MDGFSRSPSVLAPEFGMTAGFAWRGRVPSRCGTAHGYLTGSSLDWMNFWKNVLQDCRIFRIDRTGAVRRNLFILCILQIL